MFQVKEAIVKHPLPATTEEVAACFLCALPIHRHPIVDGERSFCCPGCCTVFNILLAKNETGQYLSHPLFLEAVRAGVISNPVLLEQIREKKIEIPFEEREKCYFEIGEMWCPSCAEIIRLILLREEGVINCVVDYSTDMAVIEYSPRHLSKENLKEAIIRLGYGVRPLSLGGESSVSLSLYLRFGIAAFCALNIMMFAYPLYATYFNYDGEGYGQLFTWLSLAASIPVVGYCGWPIWRRCFQGMRWGLLGMETLVTLSVAAAFLVSLIETLQGGTFVYYDSMAVIVVFVLLGKILETRAKFSSKEAVVRLVHASPKRGRKREKDGSLHFTLVKDVSIGDTLVVYAGEKIPLDGVVIDGGGTCDESLLTGEAIPVLKKEQDQVLGGTILVQGSIAYRVLSSVEASALQQIIQMVEQGVQQKTPYQRVADQIVTWFVPLVVCLASAAAFFYHLFPYPEDPHPAETAFLRALAVLLIACPCAIGIAAPVAESYLLSSLARIGVIVRNRGCLPYVGKETAIVFDKTGTVTEGKFSVQEGLASLSPQELSILRGLATASNHPVACAINQALAHVKAAFIEHLEELIGQGMRGEVSGVQYLLGSARFLQTAGVPLEEEKGVSTSVYFARILEEKTLLAILRLGDRLKPGIAEELALLKGTRLILLSGDSERVVAAVAKAAGFSEWKSGATPLEKRLFIEGLKEGHTVCMVGDGINDAPSLTAADVGISVVSATDISIQGSDLLLATDQLSVLQQLRSLAIRGRRIISQNIFWAFFYNGIGLALAFFGVLSPLFAAFAMSVSSVTVLLNAKRVD